MDPGGLARVLEDVLGAGDRVMSRTATGPGGAVEVETATWDELGNQLTRTVGTGATLRTTSWDRDARGLVVAEFDPTQQDLPELLRQPTSFLNDEAGRQIAVIAPAVLTEKGIEGDPAASAIARTGYNTFGEVESTQDANGNVTVTEYDDNGRVLKVTSPPYTGSSNLIGVTCRQVREGGDSV